MNHLHNRRLIFLVLFLGVAFSGGCGGGAATVALVPVSGKVTVNGQPVTSGQVSFITTEDKVGAGLCTGNISSDGEYKITSDGKPGAPVGKYKVTVTPAMVPPAGGGAPPAPPYNSSYSNRQTTPLKVEVVSNPKEGAYDLKLTK